MEATLRKLGYLIVPVLAVVLLALVAGITDVQGAPTLTSDKLDYFSGDTAHISGGGYAPGEYALPVMRPNGSIVRGDGSFTPGWNIVTADAEGNLAYEYKLDGIAGVYEARVYPADWSGDWSQAWIASTTFTDSVPAGNLDQCANGGVGNPPVPCTGSAWQNGNLNQNQAHYFEGDSVPYRLRLTNLAPDGTVHTVTIQWDTLKSGKHAIDYLTTYNRTETTADPCSGVSGCSGTFTSADIPLDPMVTAGPDGVGGTPDDIVQEPGKFRLFGGTITAVSVYTTDLTKGDHPTSITISFTADVSNPVLAWGGHIATRKDWGADNSAVTIPGAPYHMRMTNVDGKGGNEDRSLSTEAVIFPASITIVKQATPEGLTSFPFTASPSPLANFSLVDDGTSANTNPFLNITNFTTYSITENKPAGWNLAGIACSVTSPNGGSQTVSLPGVSIVLKEGENVTCTFTNTIVPAPALSLVKAATPATYSAVGDVISYSYLVKNTGNVTLAGPVTVTDDKATVTCPAGGLAPGASMTCTASYTITQADLDGGSVKNTAQAHANGTDSNFDDETVTAIQNPAIAIVKRTNGSDGLSILVGNQITWRYYVTNTGNVTLSKIAVSDDQGVSVSCPKTTLGVSESMTCTATGTAAAGQYNNIGTVNASDPQGDPATDNDPSSYFGANPQIAIDKVTNGADDLDIIAGTPITWTYTVTNVGNVTLSNIAVSDNQGVSVSCPKTTLAVGESMTCTATGVAVGGPHSNIGTASGSYTDDEAHSRTDTATDPSNYTGKTQVRVLKTVNNKPFSGPALTFELRQGAAPVTGQFGTVLETQEANVANNGQVTFNTLLLPGTYQLCEYVPEGYVPSYIWGTYGTDWFKPGYAPGQGGLDPNILVCVNFTVNVDGTINFQNGQQIVQPGDSIDIDNQVGQMPRTIGYWKNHASAKESNGGQGPVLDRMLYKATQAGQTITIGLLPLPGGSTPDNAGTSATYAVRLLNKSTINTNKKMASDPLFNLAAQLLGYRLNQPFGAWPNTVAATAADYAQQMLVQLNFNGTATHLKPSAKAVANLNYLAGILDAYNNDTLAIATLALPYPGVYK